MTTADLAWAAGFLEGEGYFGSSGRIPYVTAAQKRPESLHRLQSLFGGRPPRPYTAHYKDKAFTMYQWAISSRRALGVMFTLFPWLTQYRRAQVCKAVLKWRTSPGRGHNLNHCRNGHDYALYGSIHGIKRRKRVCLGCRTVRRSAESASIGSRR